MKNRIKAQAYEILLENGLSKVSTENLLFILENQGYEIIEYSQDNNDDGINELITRLDVYNYIKSSKAFTYCSQDIKIVFICEDLSDEEKRYALAHEEGHIFLKHLTQVNTIDATVTQEKEANEFAHYLLNPSVFLKIKYLTHVHKKTVLICFSIILSTVLSAFAINIFLSKSKYCDDYYVTDAGKKYHIEECIFIKNKTKVHKMTIEEFESGEYEPCQICHPEKHISEENENEK